MDLLWEGMQSEANPGSIYSSLAETETECWKDMQQRGNRTTEIPLWSQCLLRESVHKHKISLA
jgi:hypothetical protein